MNGRARFVWLAVLCALNGGHVAAQTDPAPQRIEITGRLPKPPTPVVAVKVNLTDEAYGGLDSLYAAADAAIARLMKMEALWLTDADSVNQTPSADPITNKDANTSKEACANPVQILSGNKVETEQDFASAHDFGLALTRTYNLNAGGAGLFGPKWSTPFDVRAVMGAADGSGLPGSIRLIRSDGSNFQMVRNANGRWYPQGATSFAAYVERNIHGQYVYHDSTGRYEVYAPGGSVLRIVSAQGVAWTFVYGNENLAVTEQAPNPTLQRVVHASGRFVSFTWGQIAGRWVVSQATSPSAQTYTYGYYASGHLQSVTHPQTPRNTTGQVGSDVVTYHMDTGNGQFLGKSINGVRYSTFGYDSYGRASVSEHAGGVERYTFSRTDTYTMVTNPLGLRTVYYGDAEGDIKSTSQIASTYCPATASQVLKDLAGRRRVETDLDGHQREITKDADGNVIKVVRAYETPLAHETVYAWDMAPRRLRSMRTPTQLVEYTFTAQNQVQSVSVTNLTSVGIPNQKLTTTYTYVDSNGDGLPESITTDGPAPGSADAVTTFYNAGDAVEVRSVSGSTYYGGYTGAGQPTTVTDPNGLVTTVQYDARDRVYSTTVGGIVVSQAYDVLGNVVESKAPGRLADKMTYDDARRLRKVRTSDTYPPAITGVDGNPYAHEKWMVFEPDLASNVTSTSVSQTITEFVSVCQDPECTVDDQQLVTTWGTYRTTFTDYDELNRVRQVRGNNGQKWRYTYTPGGQVHTVTDATNTVIVTNEYDALKRLKKTTDGLNNPVQYGYDADGRLTSVTDARNGVTTYSVDGLGQVWSVTSPDSGLSTVSFNSAGQRQSSTSADGASQSYGYYADGRLATVSASRGSSSLTRSYYYDSCTNGRGRLCTIVESNGERLDYGYTLLGALANQTHTIAGQTFTTAWSYDGATGLPSTMQYPNGVLLSYGWVDGVLRTIDATVAGVTRRVVDQALYQPFGPLSGYIDVTGYGVLRQFDLDGRMRLLQSAAQNWSLSYDTRNLITGIPGSDQTGMTYDAVGRLKTANQTGLNATFNFDANGNRTQAIYSTSPTLPVVYTPAGTSNRLQSVTWNGTTRTLGYDGAGNLVRDQRSASQTDCHRYDAFGRLAEFARYSANIANCASAGTPASGGQYRSNGLNQRSYKAAAGKETRYVHGPGGELLFERTTPGSAYADKTYIWFDGQIVALVTNNVVHSVLSDHLGRPLRVMTPARAVVWSATLRAYDRSVVSDQIGGFHVGYPGQYHDAESGLAYNWHRYYDPGLGRYTQSDPIGLAGGINQYAYVDADPVNFTDALGLLKDPPGVAAGGGGGPSAMGPMGGFGGGGGGAFAGRPAQASTTQVYLGMQGNTAVYTGITRQSLAARGAQHGGRFSSLQPVGQCRVTPDQARGIEQALINRNPQFQNINNSIAPGRPWYNEATNWGEQFLRSLGL